MITPVEFVALIGYNRSFAAAGPAQPPSIQVWADPLRRASSRAKVPEPASWALLRPPLRSRHSD